MQQDELKIIGDSLKSRRNELNLTLKEAENATSIRLPHLQAIEEGEMSKLISPVYAQGFIKQYAAFLGVDGDGLIRKYPSHVLCFFESGEKSTDGLSAACTT